MHFQKRQKTEVLRMHARIALLRRVDVGEDCKVAIGGKHRAGAHTTAHVALARVSTS